MYHKLLQLEWMLTGETVVCDCVSVLVLVLGCVFVQSIGVDGYILYIGVHDTGSI